ncbi:cobalamin B12-binding domain-containing protein [Carboxydothermus pertinax]|uniref:5-methyltetrahydrofolate--homocysteine methyltransferase n=1 Tax=Carboxydothermus pertinax TaxID=870242 RepID=A0A1L8CVD6_9THEO|nr:cobalamin-dependent protein [Carboxydothermus pertinax]GAV22915.1 5-methyltetrahydrofolate--homocysteine methyltransferase [Carboxydothermus pertinax]
MVTLQDELAQAVVDLDQDKVVELVRTRLESGVPALKIVATLQEGMTEVGRLFETGEYYLSELIMAGEILKEVMADLEPHLAGGAGEYRGNIVIGTVRGDVHDLGKNIVVMLLKGAGFNVIDLGVDVPKEKFVEAIKEYNAPLVGMSVLLTAALESMKETVAAVKAAGLGTKVIIGGPFMDEKVKEYCGADFYTTNASDGVRAAKEVFRRN